MPRYEMRVITSSGADSIVYTRECKSDIAAIDAAKRLAMDEGRTVEVWHGMRCVHRWFGIAQTE